MKWKTTGKVWKCVIGLCVLLLLLVIVLLVVHSRLAGELESYRQELRKAGEK